MKKTKFIFCTLVLSTIALSGCGAQVHTHNLAHHDAVAPTCTVDGTVEYWSCDGCNKKFSDAEAKTEIQDITVKAQGHKYDGQTPTYTWNSGYTECKAEVKCKNCDHKESETASGNKVTYTVVSQASCTAKEVRDYKADFTNALFVDQEKKGVEVGELAAHVYEGQTRTYTWNADNTECKAEVTCKNCTHKEEETATGTNVVATKTSDATCTAKAKYKYEASFANSLFEKQVKENVEVGELAAHVYEGQTPTYDWNADHSECKAEVQCKNCTHKEEETASGTAIVDTKTADATCTTPEYHKYEATFANALFTKQTVENVAVGNPLSHQVVTHAAKDPKKTEAGQSTTYYTCNREEGKYFSDEACTTEITADTVASYAIKSFDDLDAMLGGATGDKAYDTLKIAPAKAYMDEKYSSTAKTAYGNGAVVAAAAKYEALFAGAELNLETADYWGKLGNYLLNGADDSNKKIEFKGIFESTEYGKAYSFKVTGDYEDTDWAGARFGGFESISGTYANVFYFYSVGAAKIGLTGWDATPFVTWDVVEGWNEIVVPNDKISTAHAANQFRLVVKGLKQTDSYYKFTSVYGMKKTSYLNYAIKNMQVKSEFIEDFKKIKTLYESLSTAEQDYIVGYTSLKTAMDGAFSPLINFDGAAWYGVFGKALSGTADSSNYDKPDTTTDGVMFKVGEMKNSVFGKALPVTYKKDQTGWTGFRLSGFPTSTTAYAGLMYIYTPVAVEMGLIAWDAAPVANYTLNVGWNKVVIENATLTTVKGWSGQLRIVFNNAKANAEAMLFTTVYGLSQRQYVVETIDSINGAQAYDINKAKAIKSAYDGLEAADKEGIDVTALNAFVAKNYVLAKGKIYGSGDSRSSFDRTSVADIGLVYKVTATVDIGSSGANLFRINILDAQSGDIDYSTHQSEDTVVFYTKGQNFNDGEDGDLRLMNEGGSTEICAKATHENLANGWVKHSLTASRTRNLVDYIKNAQSGSNYLRFNLKNVANGTVILFSSFYGVHAA